MKRTKQSKMLAFFLAITMAVTMLPVVVFAEGNGLCTATQSCTREDGHEGKCAVAEKTANNAVPLAATECLHTSSKWTASEDGLTCEKKCTKCSTVLESHTSDMTAWKAPRMDGNTSSNYCRRTCQVANCTRADSHNIKGTWVEGEEHYSRTCDVCGAVETCNHSSMRPWQIDGDECLKKCWHCTYEERHTSQWGDYVEVDTKKGHYCTGRYCSTCNQANRIDTVEELLAVIEKGFKTLNIDSWEKDYWGEYEAKNSPITISEDVTIDGKGAVIERLGFGYADSKEPTFIVKDGATLTLKNLTIQGGGADMNGTCMIVVEDGNLVLDDGAVLTKGMTAIHVKNGTLVMNKGSAFTNNTSAYSSVVLLEKGIFTMNGGEFTDNKTGGALIGIGDDEKGNPADAVFVMKGGTISNNVDVISGSVVPGIGTPVITALGGTITIDDGKITNNHRGGVMVYGGSLTMNGGEISGNNTGYIRAGIMSAETMGPLGEEGEEIETVITITGGVIKDNKNDFDMPSDTLLGFSENISVEGGEIGVFGGNEEILKMWAVLNGEDPDTLNEEQLLELAKEMGFTEGQLSMKPKITGGSFGNDVKAYTGDRPEIRLDGEKFPYVVGQADITEALKNADENTVVVVVSGTGVEVPDSIKVKNETGNEITVNSTAVPADQEVTAHRAVRVETKAATCTEPGNIEYWYCEDCGKYFKDAALTEVTDKEGVTVPAPGHSFGTDWVSDENNHWHECACGEKDNTAAHAFKWITDKEATAADKGSKHEECTVCGYKKAAVEIPAAGDDNDKPGADNPQTGDTGNMWLWISLLAISAVGVGATVVSKKRNCHAKR